VLEMREGLSQADSREAKSTDARHRGGTTRSSVERPVMGREQRGRVIELSDRRVNLDLSGEEPTAEGSPLNRGGDWSRMSGDAHVRFWEGVGVRFPRATHLPSNWDNMSYYCVKC